MGSYNWNDLGALGPVDVLVVAACVLLLSEVFLESRRRDYQAGLSVGFAVLAGIWAAAQLSAPGRELFDGFARMDAFGAFAGLIVSFSIGMTSLFSVSYLKEMASERGEFHALLHLAGAGMILMAEATDLITLFVAIEVMSLSTYALTSYLRLSPRPAEAGMKYFILGSFSSAVLLYGTSLAYGAAGSTRLTDIGHAVLAKEGPSTLLVVAVALIVAGFMFKIAAVPFHTWAPDVYDGAPTTVTGFMAAGVKAAAVAAILRVLFVAFGPNIISVGDATHVGWTQWLSALAYLTMVGGNLLAIAQRSVKRMLAYSSISHAGYILVAISVGANAEVRQDSIHAALFYLAAYTVTALGAFAICAALERRDGPVSDDDTRYDGLAQRHPWMALAMAIFMLSLAGVPPTAGFMAKLFIFRAALSANAIGLAVVGVLSSVAGLYYYLRVIVLMYMRPAPETATVPPRAAVFGAGLILTAGLTLLFGIGPGLLTALAANASTLGLQ